MNDQDIRWQQRFANYKKALLQLQDAVVLSEQRALSRLEKQGVIQVFEFTHELAWNVLKDYLQDQGNQNIKGSKDATREAFKVDLIVDGEQWMAMIQSRNISSHTYDEDIAEHLVRAIIQRYFPLFIALQTEMESDDGASIWFISRHFGEAQQCVCATPNYNCCGDLRFARERQLPQRFRYRPQYQGGRDLLRRADADRRSN